MSKEINIQYRVSELKKTAYGTGCELSVGVNEGPEECLFTWFDSEPDYSDDVLLVDSVARNVARMVAKNVFGEDVKVNIVNMS